MGEFTRVLAFSFFPFLVLGMYLVWEALEEFLETQHPRKFTENHSRNKLTFENVLLVQEAVEEFRQKKVANFLTSQKLICHKNTNL